MHTPSPNVGSITTTPKEGVDYTETSDKETPLKIKKLVRKILTSLEDLTRDIASLVKNSLGRRSLVSNIQTKVGIFSFHFGLWEQEIGFIIILSPQWTLLLVHSWSISISFFFFFYCLFG